MSSDADAARLLSTDKNLSFEHEIADVLEPNAALVQFASVLGSDAVQHLCGVKGAHNFARPFLTFQQPPQQDGVDFVGIDVAAVFSDGADAVGITVGDEPPMTPLADYHLLCQTHMGPNGLGINSREERVYIGADLDMLDSVFGEDTGEHSASRAIHGINEELETRSADLIEIGEFLDGFDVRLLEIGGSNRSCRRRGGERPIQLPLNRLHDRGTPRSTVAGLVFNSIPVEWIMAGSDHYS